MFAAAGVIILTLVLARHIGWMVVVNAVELFNGSPVNDKLLPSFKALETWIEFYRTADGDLFFHDVPRPPTPSQ